MSTDETVILLLTGKNSPAWTFLPKTHGRIINESERLVISSKYKASHRLISLVSTVSYILEDARDIMNRIKYLHENIILLSFDVVGF